MSIAHLMYHAVFPYAAEDLEAGLRVVVEPGLGRLKRLAAAALNHVCKYRPLLHAC